MGEQNLGLRLIQFKERLGANKDYDNIRQILNQYRLLENEFRKLYKNHPVSKKDPVKGPSKLMLLFGPHDFSDYYNTMLYRLEYMISEFPQYNQKGIVFISNINKTTINQTIDNLNIDASFRQELQLHINELLTETEKSNPDKSKIKKTIDTILKYGNKIPPEIFTVIVQILRKYFGS
jgi:hypothetical protein